MQSARSVDCSTETIVMNKIFHRIEIDYLLILKNFVTGRPMLMRTLPKDFRTVTASAGNLLILFLLMLLLAGQDNLAAQAVKRNRKDIKVQKVVKADKTATKPEEKKEERKDEGTKSRWNPDVSLYFIYSLPLSAPVNEVLKGGMGARLNASLDVSSLLKFIPVVESRAGLFYGVTSFSAKDADFTATSLHAPLFLPYYELTYRFQKEAAVLRPFGRLGYGFTFTSATTSWVDANQVSHSNSASSAMDSTIYFGAGIGVQLKGYKSKAMQNMEFVLLVNMYQIMAQTNATFFEINGGVNFYFGSF